MIFSPACAALPIEISMSETDAKTRLATAVPANVRDVCNTLTRAGHQAVAVGGAVRDALLGRAPGDWDIASSARPEEVMVLFRNTIPTGLAHGTVTIVTGRGEHTHVEVTAFRGEDGYSDGRRPDRVQFGVSLVEDLARRDLVVNAIAYDPANDRIIDPFGGQADLERRVLRAVGDAVVRFTEDGLRVMRAVRLAAQLDFALDPTTEAGIAPALPSLTKVSRERVSDELRKLLATALPSRGLAIARRTGIVRNIAPELDAAIAETQTGQWMERIDRAPSQLRLPALFVPLGERDRVIRVMKQLKFSNAEAQLSGALAGAFAAAAARADSLPPTAASIRKQFSILGRDTAHLLLALWEIEEPKPQQFVVGQGVINDPFMVKDLAVAGADLMQAFALSPGPIVGQLLDRLHDYVLEDPTRNTREQLLARAAEAARPTRSP